MWEVGFKILSLFFVLFKRIKKFPLHALTLNSQFCCANFHPQIALTFNFFTCSCKVNLETYYKRTKRFWMLSMSSTTLLFLLPFVKEWQCKRMLNASVYYFIKVFKTQMIGIGGRREKTMMIKRMKKSIEMEFCVCVCESFYKIIMYCVSFLNLA